MIHLGVIVKRMNREIISAHRDSELVEVAKGTTYNIDFIFLAGDLFIESNVDLCYDGELSFGKAEELIKKKLANTK